MNEAEVFFSETQSSEPKKFTYERKMLNENGAWKFRLIDPENPYNPEDPDGPALDFVVLVSPYADPDPDATLDKNFPHKKGDFLERYTTCQMDQCTQ